MVDRDRLDPRQGDLGTRLRRADEPVEPRAPRALRRHQCPGNRTDPAVERQLAERCDAVERIRRQLLRGSENRQRDRKIEARSLLAQARGREVDGDAANRELELGGGDTATHTLLRLLARPVGEPDDRERGRRELQMRLDLDPPWLEADQRVRDGPCEHVATRRRQRVTCLRRLCDE